jgi:hypothetical protein
MPAIGSVETATAEALCAAMPLAPQAQLQSYTHKAGEALAQPDAAKASGEHFALDALV